MPGIKHKNVCQKHTYRDKSIDCFFSVFDNMEGTAASRLFDVFSAERIYLKQPFDL